MNSLISMKNIDKMESPRPWIFTIICGFFLSSSVWAVDLPAEFFQQKMQNDRVSEADNNSLGVDSNTYIVGPGDGFQLHIKELPNQTFNSTINETGNLLMGEFGDIFVGRMPLTQAYQAVRQHVTRSLKKEGHIYVTLNRLKSPVVSVTGPFSNPGTIQTKGNARILDAIKAANKGDIPPVEWADLRNVTVRNGDILKTLDILRFLKNNDLTQNPYAYPGDEIQVPVTNNRVRIGGQVLWPFEHQIPFHSGETLSAVLGLLILKPNADTSAVLVHRLSGALEKIPFSQAGNFHLENNDYIIVLSHDRFFSADTVSVTGEVMRSGTIPIETGKTTAAEALELAGGATANGDLSRAYVLRRGKMQRRSDGDATSGIVLIKSEKQTIIRPEMSVSLDNLSTSNDYAVLALGDHSGEVLLEAGDEVHVPGRERYVYLSGQVGQPGAYPFHPEWSVKDYVRAAGGYTLKADVDNVYLMAYYRQAYQIKDLKALQSGDIIVVPTSVEYKKFSTIFIPVTGIVLSALGLLLSIAVLTGAHL